MLYRTQTHTTNAHTQTPTQRTHPTHTSTQCTHPNHPPTRPPTHPPSVSSPYVKVERRHREKVPLLRPEPRQAVLLLRHARQVEQLLHHEELPGEFGKGAAGQGWRSAGGGPVALGTKSETDRQTTIPTDSRPAAACVPQCHIQPQKPSNRPPPTCSVNTSSTMGTCPM
jgi:hypothetical protein